MRLLPRERVELTTEEGVVDDRRFYVADERGRMVNGKVVGPLQQVVADYDHAARVLTLAFPDGSTVEGPVELGDIESISFFSRPTPSRPLLGPFAEALSNHAGRALRIMEAEFRVANDRGRAGSVSLVSTASLEHLAKRSGETIDARRFRMLIEIDGLDSAHQEDAWVDREVGVGGATVKVHGHVGRCLVTGRDAESGEPTLPMLDLLREYRAGLETTEPLAFGVYGEVVSPGVVAVGDDVRLP